MGTTDERIAEMSARLDTYLDGERAGAGWLLWLGLPALLTGVLIFATGARSFWQGLGWPLLLLGGIQVWTGWQHHREWRRLEDRLIPLFQRDPSALARQENTRMASHLPYFRRFRLTTLSVLIFGIMLALTGGVIQPSAFTLGLGTGCCLQGAVLLVLAISGHWRNEMYAYELRSFSEKISAS